MPAHKWRWWHPVLLLLILVALVAVEYYWLKNQIPPQAKVAAAQMRGQSSQQTAGEVAQAPQAEIAPQNQQPPDRGIKWIWIIMMALLASFILVAGHGITGYWRGALIDSQNKISLSRFQMILWTILILSAYLTAVMINIHSGLPNATDIALDESLWGLMGISTASLVGSTLIKSRKKAQPSATSTATPEPGTEESRTLQLLKEQGSGEVVVEGQLVSNPSPNDASWGDLFKGDDVSSAGHLDLGKVQMFYFTVITLLAYAVAIGSLFDASNPIISFPELSPGMVSILGISHAGYLTAKAASNSASK